MKKVLLLFFMFSVSFCGFAQTKTIDSLKAELLKKTSSDSTKVLLNLDLAIAFYPYSVDSVGKYSLSAIKSSKQANNYRLDSGYYLVSGYHIDLGQLDSARFYLKKVIKIREINNNNRGLSNAYSQYARTFIAETDFDKSVEFNLKAIKLRENYKPSLGESQYNLALVYLNAGYNDLAIKYFELAKKTAEESGHELLLSYVLPELAINAMKNDEFIKAKSYLDRCVLLCENLKSQSICYNTYKGLGLYYDKIKLYDKAKVAYDFSLKYAVELNETYAIMEAYVHIGLNSTNSRNYKEAIESFKKFDNMNKTNPTPDLLILAYQPWAKAEKALGNFKNSNKLLEQYIEVKDSVNTDKNKSSLANAEAKYQTEKKDKTILENELKLEKSQAKTQTMTILIISLLLASILLWFVFQQRQKRIQQQLVTIQKEQEVLTLESLIAGEEKERLRIAQELHDGVNGNLSAIKFKLSSLLKMNNEVINEAVSMIDNSCQQVRAISHNLVPPSLKDFNLIEAISNYCENMNTSNKPEISFQHIGDPIDLNKKVEVNIFRIIQELVTNAIKHAEAKTIDVQISNRNNTLLVTVEDNGKGYNFKTEENDGIGMRNIKSRVEYLNANLEVITNKNGTSNTVEIDLNKLE